jgi:hypothetical protein
MVVPAWAQEKKEAAAGEMTDATEILKKADEASKAVKSARYEAVFEGISDSATRVPKVEGKAILDGEQNDAPKRWLFEVKVTTPDSADVKQLMGGSDGENFFMFDVAAKKAYQDIDPAVLGSNGRTIRAIQMTEYIHSKPFSDEINGEKKELKGTVDVAGEKCYQIEVKYAGTPQVATWYFSTKDFLPRRVERSQQRGDQRLDTRLTVTKLEVDSKLDDKTFKPEVPAGFEKINDFAP